MGHPLSPGAPVDGLHFTALAELVGRVVPVPVSPTQRMS